MVALVTYNEIAAVSGDEPRDLFFFTESHDFSDFFFCMRSDEIICRTAHAEGRMIFHRFCGLYRIFPCNCIKFSDNLFFDHDFYPLPHLRPNISLRITTNYRLYFFRRESSRHPSLLRSFCQPLFFFFVCPPFLQAHGLFYHEPSKSATNFFVPALFSIRSSGLVSFPTSDSLFHGFSPG